MNDFKVGDRVLVLPDPRCLSPLDWKLATVTSPLYLCKHYTWVEATGAQDPTGAASLVHNIDVDDAPSFIQGAHPVSEPRYLMKLPGLKASQKEMEVEA
jgi:hypothetical protein